jgi:hypothetical protein
MEENLYHRSVVEEATSYLPNKEKQKRLSNLLIKSGLFDLLTNGIIRLKIEAVPKEKLVEFFAHHLLLKNWTRKQTEELNQEYTDLKNEIVPLKEERQNLHLQLEDMRHPRLSTPVLPQLPEVSTEPTKPFQPKL